MPHGRERIIMLKFNKKTESIWENAYQAKPQAYRKEDGEPFIIYTLTEDTPTILPMDPKRMVGIDGKPLEDFRLGLVSITEKKVIDTLPFYSCIHALSGFVQEIREPYVLIRALTHHEMKLIQDYVRAQMIAMQKLREKFEKNLEFIALNETSEDVVRRVFEGGKNVIFRNVSFPSSEIIAMDPLAFVQDQNYAGISDVKMPEGKYDIVLSVVKPEDDSFRVAGMKLCLGSGKAVSYKLSPLHMNGKEDKLLAGVMIDSGTVTFCGRETAEKLKEFHDGWKKENPGGNFYDDYLADLFRKSYEQDPSLQKEEGDYLRFKVPGTESEMVICSSGYGDGMYSVFAGYDENQTVTEMVILFISPDLF